MSYQSIQIAMQNAFVTRWQAIRPTWNMTTQFAAQSRPFTPPNGLAYIHALFYDAGGRNIAIGVFDEQAALFDVNCFVPWPASDDRTLADLAADARDALRSMALPATVDPSDVEKQDFGVTEQGYLQARVRMRFTYEAA